PWRRGRRPPPRSSSSALPVRPCNQAYVDQCCNPDMRYENPLYLAEEAAALDLIADGRLALGVSRGSPEPALRGYDASGYTGSQDPRGADLAREKFELFLRAVEGEPLAEADPQQARPGTRLRVEPHSPTLRQLVWWGAGSRDTAEWAG